jgi:hypothetical protein
MQSTGLAFRTLPEVDAGWDEKMFEPVSGLGDSGIIGRLATEQFVCAVEQVRSADRRPGSSPSLQVDPGKAGRGPPQPDTQMPMQVMGSQAGSVGSPVPQGSVQAITHLMPSGHSP